MRRDDMSDDPKTCDVCGEAPKPGEKTYCCEACDAEVCRDCVRTEKIGDDDLLYFCSGCAGE